MNARTMPINLWTKLDGFGEHWKPRTLARFNGHDVMVIKALGEFVWRMHDGIDNCILVLKGVLEIGMRDRPVHLGPGELFVVPRGVEHRLMAKEEVHLLLIEPGGTREPGSH